MPKGVSLSATTTELLDCFCDHVVSSADMLLSVTATTRRCDAKKVSPKIFCPALFFTNRREFLSEILYVYYVGPIRDRVKVPQGISLSVTTTKLLYFYL